MKRHGKARNLSASLLNALRGNARQPVSAISLKLKRPLTTVFEAEKRLRQEKIITGYCSSIDFEKAGFPIRAAFLIRAEDESPGETISSLCKSIHVNTLQTLGRGSNLFAEAVFKNMRQFLSFNEKLDAKVYYITEELKTEGAVIK